MNRLLAPGFQTVLWILWILLASTVARSAERQVLNLLPNGRFERGSRGWNAAWGREASQVVDDARQAHGGRRLLVLVAEEANVGVDSDPIYVVDDFDVNERHVVSAHVSNLGIERGGFGLRFYCYDADGRYLAMRSIGNLGPDSPKAGWQRIAAEVGPGTSFPFPKGLDHVVVRFSFWSKEGDCRGRVLIDDVCFGPVMDASPAAAREFRRTDKGAIAVWKDTVPAPAGSSNPDYLASVLEKAGFGVNRITTEELTSPAVLNADNFDLLIMPYGPLYPAPGSAVLWRYLRSGGGLVSLGGPCFKRPLYPSRDGWTTELAPKSAATPPRPMVEISEKLVASLAEAAKQGEQPAEVAPTKDSTGNPAIRVVVPDLKTYKYVSFDVQGTSDKTIIRFRARGDENTKHLCIEANEADHSRWKAVVGLSTEWKDYALSTGQFVSYATEGRGGRGDWLHAERIRRVAFGFPTSLVGSGRRSFELSGLEWRASDMPPQAMAPGLALSAVSSDLVRAFGSELRYPGGRGDIMAFAGSEPFDDAAELRAAPGQPIFPAGLVLRGRFSGRTATILEDDARLPKLRKGRRRPFLPTRRFARAVPLLVLPDGRPAASLFVDLGGKFGGGRWACFGIENRDLFPAGDKAMGDAFVGLVERMLCRPCFTTIEPRFAAVDGRARMELAVELAGAPRADLSLELQARVSSLDGPKPLVERSSRVELAPGESHEFVASEVGADQFDWKHFRVECRLVDDGEVIDSVRTCVDVRSTLRAICDRFVATQKERGDGKFSGVAFVDNRGTRGLLAAYDLFGKKEYLEAAVNWARAIVAEQRDDGGYLMGYGYHPDGNECFVADGGEIACGIARIITYVPEEEKKQFMDSLTAYMGYRDSFRCDGGGIGVGWCKRDYGARPVKPLDKITKIYAPEQNIYTIGCTLASATMYAVLTGQAGHNDAAVRDAYWWMDRCTSTSGGAFVESAVWANKFLRGESIKKDTAEFLRTKFIPHVVRPESRWWTTGGGRTVQGLDGLAYYYDCIEKDPNVLATLMRATYHVCSPEALSGIPRVLANDKLSHSQWLYINFASVSLPDLLESEIVRKPF